MSKSKTFTFGDRSFTLDEEKAEAAFLAKRVINGKATPFFNILPLKYPWAYNLYKKMKANHWEPEDIPMQRDVEQWKEGSSDIEKWIIKMGIGYFSAAEGIVGDNILHVVRELVTAPEIKLVLGRHAHEENIHADSLVYMISSLGINPHECEAMFEDIPTIKRKNEFVVNNSMALRRDLDLKQLQNQQAFAKNIFLYGQCMEGTQFYGLFGMILSLYRQNKFRGIGEMFRYTMRDECLAPGTELLTPKGWKEITTLEPNDQVAQYEEDGTVRFVNIISSSKSLAPYLWYFYNDQGHVDLMVSPNHRMVMKTISGNLKITVADDCRHNPYSYHFCCGELASDLEQVTLLSEQERFLIALQADGNISQEQYRNGNRCGYLQAKFHLKRPRKIKRLQEICDSCGFSFSISESKMGHTVFSVKVPSDFKEKKHFSSWIDFSKCESIWCKAFIEEISYWDGHRVPDSERITYTSKDISDIEYVQTIACLAGYRTHVKKVEDNRFQHMSVYYKLQVCKDRNYIRGQSIKKEKISGETMVYGVEVPSGMLLVRRNHAISVTGNSCHINLFQSLLKELIEENPGIWTAEFKEELRQTMQEAVALEKDFIRDCLPVHSVGLTLDEFLLYIDYIADQRLISCGLAPFQASMSCPLPWLAEMMDLRKEQNFFEGRVTEYAKSSYLGASTDDEL